MAFPTTGILDDFDRANESPITTNWDFPVRPTFNSLRLVSNQLAKTTGGGAGFAWYDVSTFGEDSEVYVEVPVLPGSGGSVSLACRIQGGPGTSGVDFYQASYTVGTGWRLFRVTNNAYTQLGSTVASPAMSAGDSIGLEAIGQGTIRVLHKTGGTWSQIISATSNHITGAGFLGVELTDNTVRLDNFSGGTVSVGYTLDCQPGSFSLAGTDATLAAARLFQADPASYTLTGTDATLAIGYFLSVDPAAYVVTGADASPVAGYALLADPGSYVVTGVDAALVHTTVGAYTLDVDPGTFTVTGTDATLAAGRVLSADPGTYTTTGFDADLVVAVPGAYVLDANAGTYTVTGANATTAAARLFQADPGTYTVTGLDSTLFPGFSLTAAATSYAISGIDANVLADRLLDAQAGSVAFTGISAGLGSIFDYEVDANTGTFVVTGADANLVFVPGLARLTTRAGRILWNTTGGFRPETRGGRITQTREGAVS